MVKGEFRTHAGYYAYIDTPHGPYTLNELINENITIELIPDPIDFTRVNNDGNGNPRYVCHFLAFITDKDTDQLKTDFAASLALGSSNVTDLKYDLALSRAKKLHGRKFHNKQYGGGIVFQSYNIATTEKEINELMQQYK